MKSSRFCDGLDSEVALGPACWAAGGALETRYTWEAQWLRAALPSHTPAHPSPSFTRPSPPPPPSFPTSRNGARRPRPENCPPRPPEPRGLDDERAYPNESATAWMVCIYPYTSPTLATSVCLFACLPACLSICRSCNISPVGFAIDSVRRQAERKPAQHTELA